MRRIGILNDCAFFNEVLGRIEAQSIDADVLQPEARHVVHLLRDFGRGVIQIGYVFTEKTVVVIAGRRTMPMFLPRIGVTPHIPIAVG